uniref:Retrovirus-related Pol polyprotein from transposon TNT 1-94 n=1 Tax=Cajanus cajan TaxID=3821 RepID=A0A151U6M5_CAJCA|nr:Retrovirus-related Pol polyprotein from transposon TNT 1-94 [Cajanus cajan]
MDLKTTFLNGDLKEEIYVKQLEGLLYQDKSTRYASLKNLCMVEKKTPKQWYENFNNVLVNYGFAVNTSNSCV